MLADALSSLSLASFASLAPWSYPLLFLTGLLAGLVDAMAGGGGIITLPVLLNLGLPVPVALGTNKFQSSFGSVTASAHYIRSGVVELGTCWYGIGATLVGAALGTVAVQWLDSRLLHQAIPWLLVAIVVYTIVKPEVGGADRPARWRNTPFFLIAGLLLGFYDGFFGPGVGSFWTISLVALMGYNFRSATGYTKVMNATSNVVSLVIFLAAGKVAFVPGLLMACGQLIGARVGSGLVIRNGAKFVRPLFLTMVMATVGRLLYVSFIR